MFKTIVNIKFFFETWRKNYLNEALLQLYNCFNKRIQKYSFKTKCILHNLKHKKNKTNKRYLCKILAINHDMSVTGASLSLKSVIKILEKNNCYVDLWSFTYGNNLNIFDDINCNISYIPSTIKFNFLKRKIKTYDLVICNTIMSVYYARFCFEHKIPHLFFIREAENLIQFNKQCKILKEFIKQDVSNIFCVSEYAQTAIFKIFRVNINIMHNFIQEKKININNKTTDNIIFSFVGSLIPRKGIDICVKAFLKLNKNYINKWRLYIIGSMGLENKNYWENIKNISSTCDNIIWTNELQGEKKWELFAKTDVFVVPSLDEACSRVVLEAAMLGKPCIISENVGAKYIVENNGGFIIKTSNINDLYKCILQILSTPKDELIKMGKIANINYKMTSTEHIYENNLMNFIKKNVSIQSHPSKQ